MKVFNSSASIRFWRLKHSRLIHNGFLYAPARLWYKWWRNLFWGEKWLGKAGLRLYWAKRAT